MLGFVDLHGIYLVSECSTAINPRPRRGAFHPAGLSVITRFHSEARNPERSQNNLLIQYVSPMGALYDVRIAPRLREFDHAEHRGVGR